MSSKFKPGDRVRCIDVGGILDALEYGKIYTVQQVPGDSYIDVDAPRGNGWAEHRFELAEPTTRLYLAGPMRGFYEFNFPAFADATDRLRDAGFVVFSPAERDIDKGFDATGLRGTMEELAEYDFDLRDALGADLAWITSTADGVAVLPGWEASSGARAEVSTALALGIPVRTVAHWLGAPVPEVMTHEDITSVPDPSLAGVFPAIGPTIAWPTVLMTDDEVDREVGILAGEAAQRDALQRQLDGVTARPSVVIIPPAPEGVEYVATAEEVRVTNALTGGEKGSKLARFDLIPVGPLHALAEHYGRGSLKYADRNWELGYAWSLSFAALNRHLWAWWGGEDTDEETGSSHLTAVAWHAFALLEWMTTRSELDDRPVQGIGFEDVA